MNAARDRLDRVVAQLDTMLETSARQIREGAQQVAARPAVQAYLRNPLGGEERGARAAVQPTPAQTQTVVAVDLWHADGRRALSTRPDMTAPAPETAAALIRRLDSTPAAAIGPIQPSRDTLLYPVIARVGDADQPQGYVVYWRRLAGSTQTGRMLAQLIGSDAGLFFGNAGGDVWTDFSGVVTGPPIDVRETQGIVTYDRDDGVRYLAAPAPIDGTPWVVLVEFPLAGVLAPARAFLLRMGPLAALFVVVGGIATWALSRRMESLRRQVVERSRRVQESEAVLRGITETAHDAIVGADSTGCIHYWNPGAERMFGYARDEVLGQPLSMLMPSRFKEAHARGLQRYLATREPRVVGKTVELEGRRKDGTEFPLELSLAAAALDGGLQFTGVIRDITERKRIEAALHATNAELEAFSYSVSHDLRAPLRAIHGFARILVEDYAPRLDAEGRRLVGVIDDSTRRMGQLIDDLLAFSRLGRKALERDRVDMGELARDAAEEARRAEPDRPIEITIGDLPAAAGDRDLLRQAWANLLQNAVKFTRGRTPARIDIGARTEDSGRHIVYFVRDNGAGYDPRYAGKLFGVFQRLHREEEFAGTGVGLAIVQRILERHGGRVWAEGRVDAGATFYFTLPAVED